MAYKSGYKSGFSNGYSYQGYNSGLGSYDYLKDDVVADMRDRFPDLTDSEFNALYLRSGGTPNAAPTIPGTSPTTGNTTDGAGVNVDQIAGGPLSPPSAATKAMYKKYLDQEANIRQYYKGVLDQMAKKEAATKAMYANYLQQMGVDLQKGQAAYGAQAERLAQSGLTNSGTADAASSAAYSGYVSNQQAVRAQQEASRQAYEENVAATNKQAVADIRANANEFDLKKAEADQIEAANKEAEETKAAEDAANAYKNFYDSVVTSGMTEDQAEQNLIGLGYSPELAAAAKQQFADTGIGATLKEEQQNTVNNALMGALSPTVNEETGETVPGASLSAAIQALKNQNASDDQLKIAADQAAGSIVTNIQGNIQSGNIWGISEKAVQEYLDSPYVSDKVKTQIRTELGNAQTKAAQEADRLASADDTSVRTFLNSMGVPTTNASGGNLAGDALTSQLYTFLYDAEQNGTVPKGTLHSLYLEDFREQFAAADSYATVMEVAKKTYNSNLPGYREAFLEVARPTILVKVTENGGETMTLRNGKHHTIVSNDYEVYIDIGGVKTRLSPHTDKDFSFEKIFVSNDGGIYLAGKDSHGNQKEHQIWSRDDGEDSETTKILGDIVSYCLKNGNFTSSANTKNKTTYYSYSTKQTSQNNSSDSATPWLPNSKSNYDPQNPYKVKYNG